VLAQRAARANLAALVSTSPEALLSDSLVLQDSMPLMSAERIASDPATLSVQRDSLTAAALRNRAEIRLAMLEVEGAAAEARLAHRERLPVPVLSAGYKREQAGDADQRLSGFVAGFSLPIPLLDRRRGAVDAANAEARRRVVEAEAVRRRVALEVIEARHALIATREQLVALEPELGPQAAAALRAAQVAYAEGEITLVEWLDAVRAYHEAESSYATLRAEVIIRQAALERALGASLAPSAEAEPASSRNDR
jgi:outer membrane protein TolC